MATIELPDDVAAALAVAAAQRGITEAELIAELVGGTADELDAFIGGGAPGRAAPLDIHAERAGLATRRDSLAVKVLFIKALEAEDLLTDDLRELLDDPEAEPPDNDERLPILLAISDNGTEMRSADTRRLMALCSIAQHFGRRSTPTDQAWIETLWGHIKTEHPHLSDITDPAVLIKELERIRVHYNTKRLHEAIGYVTPNDEHEGRGEQIRQARIDGMRQADQNRRAWHRQHRNQP